MSSACSWAPREHRAQCKGSAMDPAWAHTWKGLNATDPPTQDVWDTLYEAGELQTTVNLGCFNFRDSLEMAEPARTDNIIQAQQCLIPCVITSSSTQQKTELQNQDLELISHCGKGSCKNSQLTGNHCSDWNQICPEIPQQLLPGYITKSFTKKMQNKLH